MVLLHLLQILAICAAVLLVVGVVWDVVETVVLPRRIAGRFRLTRWYFRISWSVWSALTQRIRSSGRRETFLAVYGPVALLILLILWAALLIVGFALLEWGLAAPLATPESLTGFGADLYFSGTTLLGRGDVTALDAAGRVVTVVEVGTGFALLAMVIGYLPVLYQAFSRREEHISLLDAHAGSPPTASGLLLRHPPHRRAARLTSLFAEWETWSSELLESHLSYPVLAYYRSQHEEQSWVAALTMIMDACSTILAYPYQPALDEELVEQAAFTFAMARHAAADLAQVFGVGSDLANGVPPGDAARRARRPAWYFSERLAENDQARLCAVFAGLGVSCDVAADQAFARQLRTLRSLYEPYLKGLGAYLLMPLPSWTPPPDALDDWQTTADNLTAPPFSALIGQRLIGAPVRPPASHIPPDASGEQ